MGITATKEQIADWEAKGLIPPPPKSAPVQPKPSKYRNHKVEVDGFIFDSKKEARRWLDLREQQRAGQIGSLARQHEFPLLVNGIEICRYVADFAYFRDDELVVEDVKSAATRKLRDYRIKVKLLRAICGIEVKEI